MPESPERAHSQEHLRSFTEALESGALNSVRRMLNGLYPAEIAHLLESLPAEERELAWELVSPDLEGDVLLHLSDDVRSGLIKEMAPHELVAASEHLETDDLVDFIQDLPAAVVEEVLRSMNAQDRERVEAVLSYDEDTAGGLMNTDTLTVRPDVTLDVVLRYLRWRGEIPEMTDSLIVVKRDDTYLGLLSLTDLLTQEPAHMVSEVMTTDVEPIEAHQSASDVAALFEHRDLVSAPVVDEQGRLLGRITVDDVVDVIRQEADHSLMSMAGLSEEEDMFAPVPQSARRRAVWLGVNLGTAFLASWVIGLFEATIQQVVALAVLMPIVASMGGIAGSQTLTLVIRGIALGQISAANAWDLFKKELAVGALNGLLWALVVGLVALVWFGDVAIGAIIALAMVTNLIIAAVAGATIPLLLRRLGVDPALAGSVVLTTVTDVVGFMVFLGTATVVLL
ncbi:MAG TPA: magnesium transporter [Gammaproteobacteria bacterium]|nr:magnesium transporter [Gammaproteobacteria bacterium]